MTTLTPVCAWCPDAREQEAAAVDRGEFVTHGICPECSEGLNGDIAAVKPIHGTHEDTQRVPQGAGTATSTAPVEVE